MDNSEMLHGIWLFIYVAINVTTTEQNGGAANARDDLSGPISIIVIRLTLCEQGFDSLRSSDRPRIKNILDRKDFQYRSTMSDNTKA
jgi:hypothetical protein